MNIKIGLLILSYNKVYQSGDKNEAFYIKFPLFIKEWLGDILLYYESTTLLALFLYIFLNLFVSAEYFIL